MLSSVEIEALEMYKKDLIKIREKVLKKREKELLKTEIINVELEELTENDLQDIYGCGGMTKKQYECKLEQLRKYKEGRSKDKKTAITDYLRMLDRDIYSLDVEIRTEKER